MSSQDQREGRRWVGWLSVVVAFTLGGWMAPAQESLSGPTQSFGEGAELITHFLPLEGGPTQVTVIDPRQKVMSVYHINGNVGEGAGKILLKGVRPLTWDMQMDGHNTGELLPSEIRNMVQRRSN